MANPRKFSEKIALHNQKQAEETAAFEKILREVSAATSKKPKNTTIKQTLSVNQTLGSFKGGSLPNVSSASISAAKKASKVDDQNGKLAKSAIYSHSEHAKSSNYRESRHRSVGVGPMRSRAIERKVDTSPYSSTTYLSPPPDSSWRRTNSDSALHQSLLQSVSNNAINGNARWTELMPTLSNNNLPSVDSTLNTRSRSCTKSTRVPGIHIYPSVHEPGTVQIPINNNTGSLPDLTNVHYPSSTLDRDNEHSSSPYSSNQSPLSASPSTLSPTSVTSRVRSNSANFQYMGSLSQQNYLTVPMSANNKCHNRTLYIEQTSENNFAAILDALDFQQDQSPPMDAGYYSNNNYCEQKCSSASQSPTNVPVSVSTGYRSPNSRPSPQSSPGIGSRNSETNSPATNTSPMSNDYFLNHNQNNILQHLEQFSMDWAQLVQSLVDSGCTWSTQSQIENPVLSSSVAYDELLNNVQVQNQPQMQTQAQQLPSQFQNQNISSQNTPQYVHQININSDNSTLPNYMKTLSDLPADNFFNVPSNLVYSTGPVSLHTTPNTPTSIPDIILTDFSNNEEEECLSQQEAGKKLDETSYYLTEDNNLKDNCCLNTIDFDGLQLLTDTEINIISENSDGQFQLEDF